MSLQRRNQTNSITWAKTIKGLEALKMWCFCEVVSRILFHETYYASLTFSTSFSFLWCQGFIITFFVSLWQIFYNRIRLVFVFFPFSCKLRLSGASILCRGPRRVILHSPSDSGSFLWNLFEFSSLFNIIFIVWYCFYCFLFFLLFSTDMIH